MLYAPKTLETARQIRYGVSLAAPDGVPYKDGKCAYELRSGDYFYQCTNKNGKGPAGLYCGIHAKKVKT